MSITYLLENSGVCNPGGGALCSAQAGSNKALFELYKKHKLKPKAVRGASGGDLNSSLFVQAFADAGKSIDNLEELWKTISHRKVHTMWPHMYPRTTGVFKLDPLERLIAQHVSISLLLKTGIDYSVRPSRYGTEPDKEFKLTDPYFMEAVTASAAYPIMFKPRLINEAFYADAGMKNNIPITRLIQAGCSTIFVMRPSPRRIDTQVRRKDLRVMKLFGRLAQELMEAQLDLQIQEIERINHEITLGNNTKKSIVKIIEISPSVEPDLHVMEFSKKKCTAAFDDGYETAKKFLNKLK